MHEDSSEQAHLLDLTDKWPTTECLIALLSERHELLYKSPGHLICILAELKGMAYVLDSWEFMK